MSGASTEPEAPFRDLARAADPAPTVAEEHAIVAAATSNLHPRTGEPRRPWYVWAVAALFGLGAGLAVAGLLMAMWLSVDRFREASWINAVVPTEYGDGFRVVLVLAQFAIVLVIATLALVVGHYAWAGYAWPRRWALVAAAASAMALMINPLATSALAPLALGAILLWTPPLRRFAHHWWEHRHPVVASPQRDASVFYGPLPRYR